MDAWFKWQPSFINTFSDYLSGAQEDQPLLVHHWIGFCIRTVGLIPTFSPTGSLTERWRHGRP